MKILNSLIFILMSVSVALADIRLPEENKPTNEAACFGFVLFLLALALTFPWVLRKKELPKR